ncbi:putative NBD/HSP70 family sugar kinase [Pseudochelatococcus lubricantis]|uniref:NBD/HSP70 family sugar kinase n=1 Tax=Pseudochelatococcus lubricantis TaxID=1538102 RepID=A0ABX0V328_9HYPH|nr:ROK family transcriptional regulator [Pseudochelatococcus lubricantis]NIJ58949.1 putative NBD/HSP70 family sugar kinase [Pseudochelatococcus lubricantis]
MADVQTLLSYSDRRFLQLLFMEKALSRKDVARRLDMTEASISRIASRLVAMGIVSESAEREGKLGQPVRTLTIAAGQIFSAGINFALNVVDVAIIDLAGTVVSMTRERIEQSSPTVAAEKANGILSHMIWQHGIDLDAIVGVGVSVPGNFAPDKESVFAHSLFLEYGDINIADVFGSVCGMPAVIENDGACAALGEYYFANGHRHRMLFKYHLGHGFNAGIVLDGRLYRGAYGNSGVTGVLFPYGKPRPTGTDLIETLAAVDIHLTDVADLESVPGNGRDTVERWLDRAAGQLAEAVRIATGFYDPSIIVIGGRLPRWLTQELTGRIAWETLAGPSRGLRVAPVVPSTLGPSSGAIGAACVPFFDRFFPNAII